MALNRSELEISTVTVRHACLWNGGLDKLTDAFSKLSVVEEVVLNTCTFHEGSAVQVAQALRKDVKHLRVVSTYSSIHGPATLMQHLPLDQLETLDLTGSKLTDRSIQILTERLKTNTSIKTLILSNNILSEGSIRCLADALRSNTSLRELHLSRCKIDDKGAGILSSGLHTNTSLEKLVLSSNLIGNYAIQFIATMLKTNEGLKSLSLEKNPIGNEGLKELLTSLKKTCCLMELFLSEKLSTYFPRLRWEGIKVRYKEWMGPQFDLDDKGRFYRNNNPYDGRFFVCYNGVVALPISNDLRKLKIINT